MHKDEIFDELLLRLAELGIEPTNEKLPAVVEQREWSSAVSAELDDKDADITDLDPQVSNSKPFRF